MSYPASERHCKGSNASCLRSQMAQIILIRSEQSKFWLGKKQGLSLNQVPWVAISPLPGGR